MKPFGDKTRNTDEVGVQAVLPAGAFGASDFDSTLDTVLRRLAVAASQDPQGEWAEKYGTTYENDVFMMHPLPARRTLADA